MCAEETSKFHNMTVYILYVLKPSEGLSSGSTYIYVLYQSISG